MSKVINRMYLKRVVTVVEARLIYIDGSTGISDPPQHFVPIIRVYSSPEYHAGNDGLFESNKLPAASVQY